MYNLAAFATLAFALSSSAAAVAVPKATPPTGWLTEILEVRRSNDHWCSSLTSARLACLTAVRHVSCPLHGTLMQDSALDTIF